MLLVKASGTEHILLREEAVALFEDDIVLVVDTRSTEQVALEVLLYEEKQIDVKVWYGFFTLYSHFCIFKMYNPSILNHSFYHQRSDHRYIGRMLTHL